MAAALAKPLMEQGSPVFKSITDFFTSESNLPGKTWETGMIIFFVVLIVICFSLAAWYKMTYGAYTSTADSVNTLLTVRRQALGGIMSIPANSSSVGANLTNKSGVYASIQQSQTPIVNWRPLTVRLAGYLGGVNGLRDGVFDMDFGISNALHLGARSFVFDIDFLDEAPCAPVLINQDASGIHRSLNHGSIKDGMVALSKYAFHGDIPNYDPVVIVLFLRRVPQGKKQKAYFFRALARALEPISKDHLGTTEQGNFHNCLSEKILFTSEITNFQRKFIVLSNHDITDVSDVDNPKDSLNFWTNATLYLDSQVQGTPVGITKGVPTGKAAYATIGDAVALATGLTSDLQAAYNSDKTDKYKIALCPVEKLDIMTSANVGVLLNKMGVNSVPLDVLSWGSAKCYLSSITKKKPTTLADLANGTSSQTVTNPLSYWAYSGWSRKLMDTSNVKLEGFANQYEKAIPISGFTIPSPVVPKKPPPSTNSNGGLVSIA